MKHIGGTRIYIPKEDRPIIMERFNEVLDSSILTEGKYCRELESKLRQHLGAKFVIVTDSGTGALEAMIRALGLKGEIIVTTETFSATIYAILRAGCRPVLADVKLDMYLSPQSVTNRITDKTSAVFVVHVGGFISDSLLEFKEICEKNDLLLIEDAAQAMGSKYNGKYAGTFGEAAGFSLFPTKVIGSAEGGFVVTNNQDVAECVTLLKDQGKLKGNLCSVQGYNWRMNEFQAIIALSQLERLHEFIAHRAELAVIYDEFLESDRHQGKMEVYPRSKKCMPNWYKYIAFLKNVDREDLKARLKRFDITLSGEIYEVPIHVQPAFIELAYKSGDFPIAEDLCANHVCFPLMSNLTSEQAQYFLQCLEASLT